MERYFAAVVSKDPDSDYSVWFPDFPGCVTAGKTQSEALTLAREALQFHVDGMIEDGTPIPEPTAWDSLPTECRTLVGPDGGRLLSLVGVRLPTRVRRINITMDEGLLARIEEHTHNVSAFLAEAARAKLRAG